MHISIPKIKDIDHEFKKRTRRGIWEGSEEAGEEVNYIITSYFQKTKVLIQKIKHMWLYRYVCLSQGDASQVKYWGNFITIHILCTLEGDEIYQKQM